MLMILVLMGAILVFGGAVPLAMYVTGEIGAFLPSPLNALVFVGLFMAALGLIGWLDRFLPRDQDPGGA